MLDQKDLNGMKREYAEFDENREILIKKSRDVLKLSKQIIYSTHRGDLKEAALLVDSIKVKLEELQRMASKDFKLENVGAYRSVIGEYVEALLYFFYVSHKKILTHSDLGVDTESYLFGLCDLTGELVRKAVFLAGKDKCKEVLEIKDLVDEIYGELLKFDIRNGDLRRKFDAVKYDLRKLEDLVLDLKLKGKL
jgi:predicted translin family RNA/ssDNA-binding protein